MAKSKINMTALDALKWVILGIKNGNVNAALKLAEDVVEQLEARNEKDESDT